MQQQERKELNQIMKELKNDNTQQTTTTTKQEQSQTTKILKFLKNKTKLIIKIKDAEISINGLYTIVIFSIYSLVLWVM